MRTAFWPTGQPADFARRYVCKFLLVGLALVAGCTTTLPNPNYPRVDTAALQDHESTPIGQEIVIRAQLRRARGEVTITPSADMEPIAIRLVARPPSSSDSDGPDTTVHGAGDLKTPDIFLHPR